MLDASAGGALVDKTPVATKILIANRALNAQQYEEVGQRDPPRQHQVNEVVEGSKGQGTSVCGVCSMQRHLNDQCPQLIENGGWESANVISYQGQNQPKYDLYSNTYNPGWRSPKYEVEGASTNSTIRRNKTATSEALSKAIRTTTICPTKFKFING
ncbi:hypothetical protein ACFX11_025157 [Malus domestica]